MNPARSPRVLIVNDDGIDAPGIVLLEEIARQFTDDVWVVAPDEERSGAGHSLSMSHPIRMRQRDERHFAVKGTPTDCALLGIHELMTDREARPAAERHQSRPQPRRGHHLFGHGVGRHRRGHARHPLRRAQPDHPLQERDPLGHRARLRSTGDPQAARHALAFRHFRQRQFSGLPARCREGHPCHAAGHATDRCVPAPRAASTNATCRITGSRPSFPTVGTSPATTCRPRSTTRYRSRRLQVEMTAHALVPELESLFGAGH